MFIYSIYSQKQNHTYRHMQQAVGKVSSRLALEQRRQAREDLFARNRRYLQMSASINEQNFKVFKTNLGINETNRTLIEAFERRRYGIARIMEYVGLLWKKEIVQVYEGIVALLSFGEQVIDTHNPDELLGTGLVQRLLALTLTPEHSFIQQKSLDLLRQVGDNMRVRDYRAQFKLDTILRHYFVAATRLPEATFQKVIYLLRDILQFVCPANRNIYTLDMIDECVSCCLNSIETKETAAKLVEIIHLLNTVTLGFQPDRIKFTDRLYEIKRRIITFYRHHCCHLELDQQMLQVNDIQKIAQLSKGINQNTMETTNVASYFRNLLQAAIAISPRQGQSIFSSFVSALMAVKEARSFLTHRYLFDRVEELIRTEIDGLKQPDCLTNWIRILTSLLQSEEDEFFELFVNHQQLLASLCKLYEILENREVIRMLNVLVRALVTYSSNEGITETLCKHNLIEKYFKNGCRFNQSDSKEGLILFMLRLKGLKQKDISQYDVIRRLVVHQDTYEIIMEKKSYLTLRKSDEIFKYYANLREEEEEEEEKEEEEEEKKANRTTLPTTDTNIFENSRRGYSHDKQAEGRLAKYRAVQALEESDGLDGQISLRSQPVCNRCLRRHTRYTR